MSWRRAPAGLVSGPRKLKIVRTASSLRTGTTKRVAAWWAGANMKPKPASSMQRPTASGARSMPRAERLEHVGGARQARSPSGCRAWRPRSRRPAAISAAVVETLNVGRPPPVPAVSSRSCAVGTAPAWRARASCRARPASSSTVSPFVRSAIRKAGDLRLGGVAGHDLGQHRGGLARAPGRGPRRARRSPAVRTSLGISGAQRKLQQQLAVVGQHRLGVELDALGRQLAVADAP